MEIWILVCLKLLSFNKSSDHTIYTLQIVHPSSMRKSSLIRKSGKKLSRLQSKLGKILFAEFLLLIFLFLLRLIRKNKCSECNLTLGHQHLLERHFRRVHLKEKNYACDECSYESFFKHSLRDHVRRSAMQETDKYLIKLYFRCSRMCQWRTDEAIHATSVTLCRFRRDR